MPRDDGTVSIGPWGGEDGTPWNYSIKGSLYRIVITSNDDVVCSISFISRDQNGNFDQSPVFGTPTGRPIEIKIDPKVEKLVLMEGKVGTFNDIETVIQLSFTKSKNGVETIYGPYGDSQQEGAEFSCALSKDTFSGFHGLHSTFLNSIGVSVKAKINDVVPSCGGLKGTPWSYTTHGVISKISISYDKVIRAIRFTSMDINGNMESQTFGHQDPRINFREIKIKTKSEMLNGIKGTHGNFYGETVLTSISFTTDNSKSFGPFGSRTGDSFEIKLMPNEVISGFHGLSGSTTINAIGLYKRPNRIAEYSVPVGIIPNAAKTVCSYQPAGFISRIKITFDGYMLTSMRFGNTDEYGNTKESTTFGTQTGTIYDIEFDAESGPLNCISGVTYSGSYTSIQSLSFSTDKKIVFGPYAHFSDSEKGKGKEFSVPLKDGFISGFLWNMPTMDSGTGSNQYINDLGVYVYPI